MEIKYKQRTVIYVLFSLSILILTTYFCQLIGINSFINNLEGLSVFDLLLSQIANTLIVLSLTSVLSENFGQVYWIDVKDTRLVEPFWTCFLGITTYLLTALLFSVIVYTLSIRIGVVISFLFSAILLVLLTYKMISIYFGKEALRKELMVEYRLLSILAYTYYDDYPKKLKAYIEDLDAQGSGKKNHVKRINKEILRFQQNNKKTYDEAWNNHSERKSQCLDKLLKIDHKIEEYTRDAIVKNDADTIKENTRLIVDADNFTTFLSLLDDLFNWDEVYACQQLKKITTKSNAWVINRDVAFFLKNALKKLIEHGGNLREIYLLLSIWDPTKKGPKELKAQLSDMAQQYFDIDKALYSLEIECVNDKKEEELKEDIRTRKTKLQKLEGELQTLLNNASSNDLRECYLPLKEAIIAYDEGKYSIVTRYFDVVLAVYAMDCQNIRTELLSCTGIVNEFKFSYLTEDERILINQFIEKDEIRCVIPQFYKEELLKMETATFNLIDTNALIHAEEILGQK